MTTPSERSHTTQSSWGVDVDSDIYVRSRKTVFRRASGGGLRSAIGPRNCADSDRQAELVGDVSRVAARHATIMQRIARVSAGGPNTKFSQRL